MTKEKNNFEELYSIDVNSKTEKKVNLTYLSWAWAWAEIKKRYPDITYNIKKFGENKLPYVYDENTGYMVFTEVTIDKLTHEMWLPVMDSSNKAMKNKVYTYDTKYKKDIPVLTATMFDINKTIMRCLTKNLAMFGLGLYIYAGEDLPEASNEINKDKKEKWLEIKKLCNELSSKPLANNDEMVAYIKEITKSDTKDYDEIINMLSAIKQQKNENL